MEVLEISLSNGDRIMLTVFELKLRTLCRKRVHDKAENSNIEI